ncbi:hypothetical protein CODIS_12240 [Candidatus Thiodiazotropha endolucinida]|uniref:Uncharacterized protein n=1 Tax=Candidatus Thiodiazotropha endolucinida TaxID=1655433 RepID=A0A7Z0VNF7_9GAMM|nr:hypothetical protein CODIS_12240 [Candidatus Thiodiazotropha endolucinida]
MNLHLALTGPNTIQAANERQSPQNIANGMTLYMHNKQTVRGPATGFNNLSRESEYLGIELNDFGQLIFLTSNLRVIAVIGVHLRHLCSRYTTRLSRCGVLAYPAPFIFKPIR